MSDLWTYVVLGLPAGATFALFAFGMIAVYRGTGVLNFAHAAMGSASVYIFWSLYNGAHLPWMLAGLLAVLAGILIACAFYLLAGRLLGSVTETGRTLVTLGVVLLCQGALVVIYGAQQVFIVQYYGNWHTTVFGATVIGSTVVLLAVAIVSTFVLALVFQRTRLGRITTAIRDSPMGVQTLGYSPIPWELMAWAMGGGLAAVAGVLILPTQQLTPTSFDNLLVPALGAAMLARFRSFGVALAAGLAIGIAQAISQGYGLGAQLVAALPYAITLAIVMVTGRVLPGRGTVETSRLFKLGSGVVRLPAVLLTAAAVVVICMFASGAVVSAVITSGIFALVGLSIVVCTGYTGQLSLAPMALAGIATLLVAYLSSHGTTFVVSVLAATAGATVVGLIVGAPSVRVRGVGLTVATLALALIIENAVLPAQALTGGANGFQLQSPSIAGLSIDSALHTERYAYVVWFVVLLCAAGVATLRRSDGGRRLLAVRSDERAAASLGVSVAGAKLTGFAISSVLAGLAGALLGYTVSSIGGTFLSWSQNYSYFVSLTLVGVTAMAGAGTVVGGVIAGLLVAGGVVSQVMSFWPQFNNYLPILFGLNLFVVYVRNPDGFVPEIVLTAQNAVRRLRGAVRSAPSSDTPQTPPPPLAPARLTASAPPARLVAGEASLVISDLVVHYGGVTAVDGVSLAVRSGEVLGVLGPNGAGKSSLLDAIGGFVAVERGSVVLNGTDVTRLSAHRRARLGLARAFQDHLLFEDLTVRENLLIAEDRKRTRAYAAGLVHPGRATSDEELVWISNLLGLRARMDDRVGELSLGWRARVSLARVLALRPSVMCLDEPAAGLSSDARVQLAAAIRRLARELSIAVVLVEHNIDVIEDSADRVVVLDLGATLATGEVSEVLARPDVRDAYLGTRRGAVVAR
jgi:sulfate-transporting ATPase